MSNKNNSQNNANNTNHTGAEVKAEHVAPAVAAGAEVTETKETIEMDTKAKIALEAATETESVSLGWTDIMIGAGLGGFATFARRTATKLMVDRYNQSTGEDVDSPSWAAVAAHTAASAVVTGAVVGVCQKTVMKNLHPIQQGGVVILTSQAVNLVDALVGDMTAKAVVGAKSKLSDMFSKEEVVVAE